MMLLAKRHRFFIPRWDLSISVLLLSLLLLGYGVNQYRQHRDYSALEQNVMPVVKALHHLQHKVEFYNENGQYLNEKIVDLSLAASSFMQFANRESHPPASLDEVLAQLEHYQQRLQQLQDADMRSRYALSAFADRVNALNTQANSEQYRLLLRRSQLYTNATNLQYLYALDDDASRLQPGASEQQQEALYFFQLYWHSLEKLVQLRYDIAVDDSAVLLAHASQWREQAEDGWQGMVMALSLILLLYFGLGLAWLVLRNRELRDASEAAFALARAKTDFLANMSHEIRTPMNAIIGFSSLLQQTPLTMQQLQYLKKIENSSDNLLLLINDILDLTKVEAGKLELEDIEFDLNEQLERLSGLFSDMSEHKQLEVIIDKDPAVPDRLHGDPLRLGQVLVNLVNNAVKFTERGEVVLKVFICNQAEPRLCFTVTDTGIGIIPAQLDRLFHSFTQVDASTTRKYGGTGLGLSITHHLVQLMQGTIEVSSQPGRGSTFTVHLPLQPVARVRSERADRPSHLKGRKILLVDDNVLVIEVLGQLLRQLGLVVYSASNINDAKELLLKRGSELELALIDCCLGQDSGLDLARHMLQQPHLSHIKVAMSSAFGQEKPAEQMRTLGLNQYLAKPVTEHSLRHCLERLLHQPEEQEATPSCDEQDLAPYQARLLGKQILLAEDNRMNQQLIVEFLKKIGVSVTLANNGRQAVELTAEHNFDAILMDLQMPILDGIEATRQIRKLNINHDIPIVALTASAMRGDREASLTAGMNSYVTKPVNRFDLYQALMQVLAPVVTQAIREQEPEVPPVQAEPQRQPMPGQARTCTEEQQQFIAQHQDDGWLLQALLATENWPEAQRVVRTLAEQARACGLVSLANQVLTLLLPLQREQRPSAEQISELNQLLAEEKQRLQAASG
ncbi:response regulator [Oceanisphaera sp.]|uniref:hybrid sensor histidine kinase/response regulator n=1 Tax=Oceanisphaera sp. TaxID=1929979 RepID=UPI003A94F22F